MSSVTDARNKIKQFTSLSKVAKQLGFFLSDDYAEGDFEFVLVPIALKGEIPEMIEIREQSGYHKRYPIIDCEDLDQVIVALSAIATARNKYLDRTDSRDNTWQLTTIEKLTQEDLKSLEKDYR